MPIPKIYRAYPCQEYFTSGDYRKGVWSEPEQLWIIVSEQNVTENHEIDFLMIGRPGVDGIEFGYRKHQKGIWAYYPIENEFRFLAQDIEGLLDGWQQGKIVV